MSQLVTGSGSWKQKWASASKPDHVVHFYPTDTELITSLLAYVGTGLKKGDTCIVIATPKNIIGLNKALRDERVDVAGAINSSQYVTYDAEELLESFMLNERPDLGRFLKTLGGIISLSAGRAKPIRAFGEMVAVLLKKGNLEAVIQLEKYWGGFVEDHSFSLYCAYPEHDFDGSPRHRELINKICTCHTLTAAAEQHFE